MTGWLANIANKASYLYGNTVDDDEDTKTQTTINNGNHSKHDADYDNEEVPQQISSSADDDTNTDSNGNRNVNEEEDNKSSNNNQNTNNSDDANAIPAATAQDLAIDETSQIFCSANGELWKFSPKREEFKLKARQVQGQIIDCGDFLSLFQILNHNGSVLFQEAITNELQIQFDKTRHSMVFTQFYPDLDTITILSFIFLSQSSENEFKSSLAIKLFEHNRQESFESLLKKKQMKEDERDWVQNAFEVAPNQALLTDDQLLDEDVQMVTIDEEMAEHENENGNNNNSNISSAVAPADNDDNDDNNDYEEREEEEREEEDNKWQKAADSRIESANLSQYQSADQALLNEMDSDHNNTGIAVKRGSSASNKMITGSKVYNRTYVVRQLSAKNCAMGFLTHNENNELEYQGKMAIKDMDGKSFTPSKVLQFKSDTSMLLLDPERKPGHIALLDLSRGAVVEEWKVNAAEFGGVSDITPFTKNEQMTDNPLLYGLNHNSMFLIDSRVSEKESKLIASQRKQYKSKIGMRCMATSEMGFIATGADNGNIRLHDCVGKRAKTKLPGIGQAIHAIEVSNDGAWILATCLSYVLAIPTAVPGCNRTGFEGNGMRNAQKPNPYVLRLKVADIQKYKLGRAIAFTAAHFDNGQESGSNFEEKWIVTSTGPYIIKWDFQRLKRTGITTCYSIRKRQSRIINNEFRFDRGDELLVSEADSVYAQHSSATAAVATN